MPTEHILIVEDEREIADLLKDYVINAGYDATWLDRGDKVVPFVRTTPPALILLDLLLPGKDGIDVCRDIRKFSQVPIIMVTAKVEEVDRLIGLELGADDYICKPFSPREVVARVKAVLRRTRGTAEETLLTAGTIQLNEATREVHIDGQDLKLTPSEFGILQVMMTQPKRVFSRSQLIEQVQGYQFDGYERTIDFHIKNLRKKIALHLPDANVIQSVYGSGYKFIYE